MKVTDRSPQRLRLAHFGWYYAAIALVFGLLCLWAAVNLYVSGNLRDAAIFLFLGCGAALGLGLVATRSVTVILDRKLGIAHVHNTTALGRRTRAAPLAQLREASIQTSYTGDTAMHRLVLLFNDRDGWVVTNMYTSGDGAMVAAEAINNWLRDGAHFEGTP